MRFASERKVAQDILLQILKEDIPPNNWTRPSDEFYFFKVWLTLEGITATEIRSATVLFGFADDEGVGIDLQVRDGLPSIQFHMNRDAQLNRMVFPLNNCLFQADLNRDGEIDLTDVNLATVDR